MAQYPDMSDSPSSIGSFGLTAGTNPLIGANDKRYAIMFTCSPGNTVFVNNQPIKAAGGGLSLPNNGIALLLLSSELGNVVKKPWHAFAVGAGNIIQWIELTHP